MKELDKSNLSGGKVRLIELAKKSTARKRDGYLYQVEVTIDGKRTRKFFRHGHVAEARQYFDEVVNANEDTNKADTRAITDGQLLSEANQGKQELAKYGKTIKDAVEFYIEHLQKLEKHGETTVKELVRKFLGVKEGKVRPRTYEDLDSRLKKFEQDYGDTPVALISRDNIRDWLRDLNLSDQSVINYWRALHNLFNFAVLELELIESNPVRKAFRPRDPKRDKTILYADEVFTLLNESPNKIVPALVLMTFCGIRTEEITKLDWSDIDWEDNTIELGEDVAKTNKERHVTIPTNAIEWLKPYKKRRGLIADYKSKFVFMKAFKEARDKAGFTDWKTDTLRKTFISHHYGTYENAALTVKEAGNSHSIMEKHYKKPMKKKEAEKLWNVLPDEQKVVKIS